MTFKSSDDIAHAALYVIPDHHYWTSYAADFFYNDEWGGSSCVDAVASGLTEAKGKEIYRVIHREGAYCFVGTEASILIRLKKLEKLITQAEEADIAGGCENVNSLFYRLDAGEKIEDIYDQSELGKISV
jgi:hypothetical protein